MRRVSAKNIKDGMKLAKTVYSANGEILLNAGTILKEAYSSRLLKLKVHEIYIDDDISEDIQLEDVVSEKTRQMAKAAVREAMDELSRSKKITLNKVSNSVNDIVDDLMSNRDIQFNLLDLRAVDDYLFGHSVNVCVLAVTMAKSMGYDQSRIKEIGVGAMLHDIGKLSIPKEVMNKPAKLTPEEFKKAQEHSIVGYNTLKQAGLPLTTAGIALCHHERFDGSGYPLGLKGKDIHQYSRIVAIADVYDAILSDRVYQPRVPINEAYEYILGASRMLFDYDIVKVFIEHISMYPIGTTVRLSTEEKAIVIYDNKVLPNRPIVRVVADKFNNKILNGQIIDLKENPSIVILDTTDV